MTLERKRIPLCRKQGWAYKYWVSRCCTPLAPGIAAAYHFSSGLLLECFFGIPKDGGESAQAFSGNRPRDDLCRLSKLFQ